MLNETCRVKVVNYKIQVKYPSDLSETWTNGSHYYKCSPTYAVWLSLGRDGVMHVVVCYLNNLLHCMVQGLWW